MGTDRKHMKRVRQKRIDSIQKQIEKHEDKIENEEGRLDTTKDYWRKEIDEKFLKQIEEDKGYLSEETKKENKKEKIENTQDTKDDRDSY
jgi:hypothetical protein